MNFNEKLKALRESRGLTQQQLADKSKISSRMIQKYEAGTSMPRFEAAKKIADALEISVSELLGDKETLIAEAGSKYGSRGAKQAKELMDEVTGLFAGGEMSDEDMDVMMKAIQDAYWIAKKNNKKYSRK